MDTVRSLRVLALSHSLGHVLMEENDRRVPLLERLVQHAAATARYSVYYGEGRDAYDERGRVAHESIFNVNDGNYRCPGTAAGMVAVQHVDPRPRVGNPRIRGGAGVHRQPAREGPRTRRRKINGSLPCCARAAQATAEFYIANTAADGIPYWDTGAPGLAKLGAWRERPADPFNEHEPVDSSAAAIACQGLARLGSWLRAAGDRDGERFQDAGLAVLSRLLEEPYLSTADAHQGLLLHSVYHRPNGWDHVPAGRSVPCGESSMWGDYHLREAALHAQRLIGGGLPLMFWRGKDGR